MNVYEITYQAFNYNLIFGSMLGLALILMVEHLAGHAVTFVKGWRS